MIKGCDIINIISKLNDEVDDIGLQELSGLVFSSNGTYDKIEFLGELVWDSEDEEPDNLEIHLRKQIMRIVAQIIKIKL